MIWSKYLLCWAVIVQNIKIISLLHHLGVLSIASSPRVQELIGLSHTKNFKIGSYCFSAKHSVFKGIKWRLVDSLLSDLEYMPTCGLFLIWASTINIQLSVTSTKQGLFDRSIVFILIYTKYLPSDVKP